MGEDSIRCRLCGEAYRLITPTHLRRRHGWTSENPGLAYKARYKLPSVWSRASRRAMSASLVEAHDRRGRVWTRERVLAELRRHRSARFRDLPPTLYWSAQRLFGRWEKALEAAKLPKLWPEWTRERVVREIRALRNVRWSAVSGDLYWAGQRLFGSWTRALTAAGVSKPEPKWTAEKVLDALRARAKKGRSISSSAVRADDLPLYKAAFRLFRRWRAATSRL